MSKPIQITEEHYKALCAAVEKKHGCKIVDKDDAVEMGILESLFDKAREYAKLIGKENYVLSGLRVS